jgi:hypothetical protein
MAAPNVNAPTAVRIKSGAGALTTTSETAMLTNAASSGLAQRVRSITVANNSSAGTADVTVRYYGAASGGTALYTVGPLTVPVGGAGIPIGSENICNLEEDRRLTIQASAANYLSWLISYDEVS